MRCCQHHTRTPIASVFILNILGSYDDSFLQTFRWLVLEATSSRYRFYSKCNSCVAVTPERQHAIHKLSAHSCFSVWDSTTILPWHIYPTRQGDLTIEYTEITHGFCRFDSAWSYGKIKRCRVNIFLLSMFLTASRNPIHFITVWGEPPLQFSDLYNFYFERPTTTPVTPPYPTKRASL